MASDIDVKQRAYALASQLAASVRRHWRLLVGVVAAVAAV